MILFYPGIALVVLWSVWTGATRMAQRAFLHLGAAISVLLAGAGACWLIGQQKSDYSGLFATIIAMLPLLAAGSVASGAAMRGIHDLTRRRIPSDPDWAPSRSWDVWALWALAVLSVVASLLA